MNPFIISFSLILVIIIVLISVLGSNNILDVIPGFWTASEKFCASIGVNEIIMYFDKPKHDKYPCYILIVGSDSIYENINTTAKISSGILGSSDKAKSTYKFKLSFEDKPQSIPQHLIMKINTTDGSLILIKDEVIYAMLYRDNKLTADIAIEQEEQEKEDDVDNIDSTLVNDIDD